MLIFSFQNCLLDLSCVGEWNGPPTISRSHKLPWAKTWGTTPFNQSGQHPQPLSVDAPEDSKDTHLVLRTRGGKGLCISYSKATAPQSLEAAMGPSVGQTLTDPGARKLVVKVFPGECIENDVAHHHHTLEESFEYKGSCQAPLTDAASISCAESHRMASLNMFPVASVGGAMVWLFRQVLVNMV